MTSDVSYEVAAANAEQVLAAVHKNIKHRPFLMEGLLLIAYEIKALRLLIEERLANQGDKICG